MRVRRVRAAMGFGAYAAGHRRLDNRRARARRRAGAAVFAFACRLCVGVSGNPHDHQMWLAVWLTTDHLHGWLCTCAVHTIRVKIALSSERMRNCDR